MRAQIHKAVAAFASLFLAGVVAPQAAGQAANMGDWRFINVDPKNAPAGYLEAKDLSHPFWRDVFGKYSGKTGCFGYGASEAPKTDPYNASFTSAVRTGFASAEAYLIDQGFKEILKRPTILSKAFGQGIKPVFCSHSDVPVLKGIDHDALGRVDNGSDPFKDGTVSDRVYAAVKSSFFDAGNERSWKFAAASHLVRTELLETMLEARSTIPGFGGRDYFDGISWIGPSGMLDAVTVRAVENKFGEEFGDYSEPQTRYPYLPMKVDIPLFRNDETNDDELTAGAFWWFVADQYLERDGDLIDGLREIFKSKNSMAAVDTYLDSIDGPASHGLETVYPQFAAHYLGWAEHRFNGGVSEEEWLQDAINGCERLTISDAQPTAKTTVKIKEYSSVCLEFEATRVNASWQGAATIAMYAPKDEADDLYVAGVKYVLTANSAAAESSKLCADVFNAKTNSIRCMITPEQGVPKDDGRLYRYMTVNEIDLGESARSGFSRFVLSYVPKEHRPHTESPSDDRSVEFEVSVSTDLTILTSDIFEQETGRSTYGAKVGLTPVGPLPDKQISGVEVVSGGPEGLEGMAIFEGDGVGIDPGIFKSALATSARFISLEDDSGNGLIIPVTEEFIPGEGAMGEIEVFPSFGLEGQIAIAHPQTAQKIKILQNDDDSFHFEADFSLCMMSQAELMAQGLAGKEPDICRDGEKKDVAATVAIPFPASFDPERSITPAPTENYRNLRNMRLGMIAERFGRSPDIGARRDEEGETLENEPQDPPGSPSSPGGSAGPGGSLLSCSMLGASGACDCSCEAKVCYAKKKSAATLVQGEKACRLTCGKKWASCPS